MGSTFGSILLGMMVFSQAAAAESHVIGGGRYNFWANGVNSGFGTFEEYPELSPVPFAQVDAGIEIADRWFVGAIVGDDPTLERLRNAALRLGIDDTGIFMETGQLVGSEESSFEGRYRLFALYKHRRNIFGRRSGGRIGGGLVLYDYPSPLGSDSEILIAGVHVDNSNMLQCMYDKISCDVTWGRLLLDEDHAKAGFGLEIGGIYGVGVAQSKPAQRFAVPDVAPRRLVGVGYASEYRLPFFWVNYKERVTWAWSFGVEGRTHSSAFFNAESSESPGSWMLMGGPFLRGGAVF